MKTRILWSDGEAARPASDVTVDTAAEWVWVDVQASPNDFADLVALTAPLQLDALAMRDAVDDLDLPKVDDFGDHLLVVLHGVHTDRVQTYEIDCFVTAGHLVTVHRHPSDTIDLLWEQVQENPTLAAGGVDELLGRLADVLTRRLLSIVDAFDDRIDDLITKALTADPMLLEDLTAVRTELTRVRRSAHPQREALDVLRRSTSPLLTNAGRRRFSDVFDAASRASQELNSARTSLAETLDAYRGAEARAATDVTKVLTIYAAIMLPLSLVAGFFGMNFVDLPWTGESWGWIVATVVMAVIAAVSLGTFIALGWIRRPSSREAGVTLGRGLAEAARTPAQVVGAVLEVSKTPLRALSPRLTNREDR